MSKKKSTIIHEGSDKPAAPKSRHYVDNKAFYAALVERKQKVKQARQQGLPPPKVDDFIGECLLQIAKNLQKKYNFNRPQYASFREEMIGDAVINALIYVDKFDVETSKNPFSYFTQSCYYQFIGRIEEEERRTVTRYKATLNCATLGQLAESEEGSHAMDNLDVSLDNMESIVAAYDKKQEDRKKRAKERRQSKKRGLENFFDEDGDNDE